MKSGIVLQLLGREISKMLKSQNVIYFLGIKENLSGKYNIFNLAVSRELHKIKINSRTCSSCFSR